MLDILIDLDHKLFFFLNTFVSNSVFDLFFKFITDTEHLYMMLLFMGIIFLFNKKIEALKVIGIVVLAMGLSDLLGGQLLKPLFHRLRPSHPNYFVEGKHLFLEGANFLLGMKRGGSMPSNHAMNSFTFATVLTLFYPKNFFYYYIFAFLVAFSRIYVGVHYPSDVFCGAILGIVIGMFIYYLFYYIKISMNENKKLNNLIEELG